MKEISKAILNVMQEVKGIEKSMTVGSGSSSYQGVPDKEVKKIIGESMVKNGLCILPTSIESNYSVSRWEESVVYNGNTTVRQKQSVFTEVKTKYLLIHESGESIELAGYGHGVDSQDKGAGKATTYALKYALLYAFLVPTGKIDDADNHHSDQIASPSKQIQSDTNLEDALKEVLKSESEEQLSAIWKKFASLQKTQFFIDAVKAKKGEFTNVTV